jgi:hypothetical protein
MKVIHIVVVKLNWEDVENIKHVMQNHYYIPLSMKNRK